MEAIDGRHRDGATARRGVIRCWNDGGATGNGMRTSNWKFAAISKPKSMRVWRRGTLRQRLDTRHGAHSEIVRLPPKKHVLSGAGRRSKRWGKTRGTAFDCLDARGRSRCSP